MFSLKSTSFLLVALATLTLYPLAACAEGKNELNKVEESEVKDAKELKSVKIKLHGKRGTVVKDGDFDQVVIDASGNSSLKMKGTARDVEVDVSGSAKIDLRGLVAEKVDLNLSGSADVYLNATKSYKINVSGSGDVYLYGRAKITRYSKSGSGSVEYVTDEE